MSTFPDLCLKSNFVQRRVHNKSPCLLGICISQREKQTIKENTSLSLILTTYAEWAMRDKCHDKEDRKSKFREPFTTTTKKRIVLSLFQRLSKECVQEGQKILKSEMFTVNPNGILRVTSSAMSVLCVLSSWP
jgi:hypothetical protein